MIAFGSKEAEAIKAADAKLAKDDEFSVILDDIKVGVNDEVELMLPPHSFLMDVIRQVEQNEDDDFLEAMAYAHDDERAFVAVCPKCKNAPLISAIEAKVTKGCLLNLLWAIVTGYEVRILPNDEAKETFNAKQCVCRELNDE